MRWHAALMQPKHGLYGLDCMQIPSIFQHVADFDGRQERFLGLLQLGKVLNSHKLATRVYRALARTLGHDAYQDWRAEPQ